MKSFVLFVAGCLTVSAYAQNEKPAAAPNADASSTFLAALKSTAGEGSIGCGLVELNANTDAGFECAESALKEGKPFWLALKTDASDVNQWSAAARNKSGALFFVTTHSGGVSKDPKKTPILTSKINKCGWLKFQNDPSQPIVCLRPHN